ncbi:MAG: S8 family serine peptidase, partial [Acidobacteria bacterium]|nr:S8 family serine peptidase [Acidobacteriota bacterium]
MRITTFASRVLAGLLLVTAVTLLGPAAASGQGVRAGKLDPVLQARARQLAGRSRVIIEFQGAPDVRVITGGGGLAGRQLNTGAQVADIDNALLVDLARNPQVASVRVDRPAFPTLDRTGAAIAATVARRAYHLTGKGVGVAIIDSGITGWHDDLYLAGAKSPRASPRVVHFKDFTVPSNPRVWTSDQPSDDYGHGTHVAGIIA